MTEDEFDPLPADMMRARRARELVACGATMPNDRRLRSGRVCDLDAGHTGPHASQMSRAGALARRGRWDARLAAVQGARDRAVIARAGANAHRRGAYLGALIDTTPGSGAALLSDIERFTPHFRTLSVGIRIHTGVRAD